MFQLRGKEVGILKLGWCGMMFMIICSIVLSNELRYESPVIRLSLNCASLEQFNVFRELVWNGGMLIGLSVVESIELESCSS